ncbi:unnamed protein product [Soboliphyme baturini]|uniref:Glucosidase 2 subunit beta n=1 Tax=Soboliphyme baturini TaxID=241478 RepID=A0A183ICX2_9BILA|nr:unnamed protein product [Soboliphyme baturini]
MCLDGSRTIPFEWVNDDYCDCRDGSDEPGTAACPNGSFHCANLGHLPLNIPSSRVNDQICDCCDGSDEYSGWVHCPNTCEEMGRKMREEMRLQEERQTNGYQIRQKMAIDGKKRKVEKQVSVNSLLFSKYPVEQIQARKEFDLNADGEISPEEVKVSNEARMKHSDVQSKIRRLEADLKEAEEYMKINFGPNDEFAPLYQQCFEIALSEYVYKLCLFEKATQRSKDTSMETALGSWGKWITIGEDGFYKMLYEHGAQCWNGPERSTTVDLVCGLENALVASSEPSRCQYAFTFATPAVCDLPTHKNHYEGEL